MRLSFHMWTEESIALIKFLKNVLLKNKNTSFEQVLFLKNVGLSVH